MQERKVYRIKVSRQGLTRCPACSSHIRVAAQAEATDCPFCGVSLMVALQQGEQRGRPRAQPPHQGRLERWFQASGAALATAGLVLAVGAGCNDDPDSNADAGVQQDMADDNGPVALYGPAPTLDMGPGPDAAPGDMGGTIEQDMSDTDMTAAPEYGLPADMG